MRVFAPVLAVFLACGSDPPGTYTPCEAGAKCGRDTFCLVTPKASLCVPYCDSQCAPVDGVTPECANICQLRCASSDDCPEGMICDITPPDVNGLCGWET